MPWKNMIKGKEKPNWTTKMGQMVATMNSRQLKGQGQVSPFKAVFGMDFMDVEILRKCSTLGDRFS
jgi:hypothetical protein